MLRIDNTTAICYIKRMGGIRFENLSRVAKDIWSWCEMRDIWLVTSYVESANNFEADLESRRLEPETEFQLNNEVYGRIIERFGHIEMDFSRSGLMQNAKNTCPGRKIRKH